LLYVAGENRVFVVWCFRVLLQSHELWNITQEKNCGTVVERSHPNVLIRLVESP
jgi:hypothetical protein